MTCYHPLPAYKSVGGDISIGDYRLHKDTAPTKLPCGSCLGCVTDRARGWALRCTLELHQHNEAVFSTLTYDEEQIPSTLEKPHLTAFLKRLRKRIPNKLKFFASGEYGEQTRRPHYHAILYGMGEDQADIIEKEWGKGHVRTERVTPARIAYVAGYVQKKIDFRYEKQEWIDYSTGEVVTWQPPFIHMSRRPGIASDAKKFVKSWRSYAVLNDTKIPVPRYFHEAWKEQATPAEIEELEQERYKLALERDHSNTNLEAKEQIAIAKQKLRAEKRHGFT